MRAMQLAARSKTAREGGVFLCPALPINTAATETKPKGHPMRTILYRDTFYEVCPRCGLSLIDYLTHRVHFPCPVCRNGKLRPGEADQDFCGSAHHGPRF